MSGLRLCRFWFSCDPLRLIHFLRSQAFNEETTPFAAPPLRIQSACCRNPSEHFPQIKKRKRTNEQKALEPRNYSAAAFFVFSFFGSGRFRKQKPFSPFSFFNLLGAHSSCFPILKLPSRSSSSASTTSPTNGGSTTPNSSLTAGTRPRCASRPTASRRASSSSSPRPRACPRARARRRPRLLWRRPCTVWARRPCSRCANRLSVPSSA